MKVKQTIITFLLAIVAVLGGGYGVTQFSGIGGGTTSDSSNSTSTSASWGTVSYKVLKVGAGTFDGFNIMTSKAAAMNFYDGTTTNALKRTNTATTTLAEAPASLAAGTYPFGTKFQYGLIVEYPTALGVASGTIMWR